MTFPSNNKRRIELITALIAELRTTAMTHQKASDFLRVPITTSKKYMAELRDAKLVSQVGTAYPLGRAVAMYRLTGKRKAVEQFMVALRDDRPKGSVMPVRDALVAALFGKAAA